MAIFYGISKNDKNYKDSSDYDRFLPGIMVDFWANKL